MELGDAAPRVQRCRPELTSLANCPLLQHTSQASNSFGNILEQFHVALGPLFIKFVLTATNYSRIRGMTLVWEKAVTIMIIKKSDLELAGRACTSSVLLMAKVFLDLAPKLGASKQNSSIRHPKAKRDIEFSKSNSLHTSLVCE